MKRDPEKKAIRIWLECFNELRRTDFVVESYPDELDRDHQSIDALCKDSSGERLGLEHTRIEAFPGEMTDNQRFLEVFGNLERDPRLTDRCPIYGFD